ncbi:MAG TPA: ABC transporter substrate-binding protein [Mycobacteriales bacterium]|nr:ABC transporter substrate-binding protein [Mycobacteriales bacterium]
MKRAATAAVLLATAATVVAGCGSSSSGSGGTGAAAQPSTSTSASAAACTPSTLKTKTPGTLTIGADRPVYPPWFVGNNPSNGKGFEGAVDAAIAKQLGYTPSQVKIDRVSFNQAILQASGFDFDLDEYSITKAREQHVDFSAPYYNVSQAVVTVKGSKAAGVTTLAGLKSLKIGVQVGTTAIDAVNDIVKPSQSPAVFPSNAAVLQALKNGQIDALITDLPTAFYMTSAQLTGGIIVGQLPPTTGKQEQFGALLAKDSPLTSCVSKAINTLRSNGELAKIQDKWLAKEGNAPVLK